MAVIGGSLGADPKKPGKNAWRSCRAEMIWSQSENGSVSEEDIKVVQVQAFVGVADLLADNGVDAIGIALGDRHALVRSEGAGLGVVLAQRVRNSSLVE